jgi:predicted AAA+ superfamily ATPase
MDRDTLKEILLEQQELLQAKDTGVERDCLAAARRYLQMPHIVVVSGLRRCGKSTLLLQIMRSLYKTPVYYFNFEDERLSDFAAADFNVLHELFMELIGESEVFFFDEVQNVPGWEAFARRMHDAKRKLYITGSNASLLSKEIGTRLTGRYLGIELYPFSFSEYLRYKGVTAEPKTLAVASGRARMARHLGEYLYNGGLPDYVKYGDRDILTNLYNDIIYRDVVARYDIKQARALRDLAMYLLSNPGTLASCNRLRSMLGLGSVNTVSSYLEYLENTFLIATVPLYTFSARRQAANPRKVYAVDNGMVRFASVQFSRNRGRFLENLVFLELKRRRKEVYYYRTAEGGEVDFVVKEGTKAGGLIQVALSLSAAQVRRRETAALVAAMKELKVKRGTVVTENDEETISVEGKTIRVVPVCRWLLGFNQGQAPVFRDEK